jgi:hypothetical protein
MGSGCIDPHFLDPGTSWRWVVNFMPRPLYPRGKSPRYQWTGGWWAPEPVWTTWRRKHFWPYRGLNSDLSVVLLVASRYTDCAISAPYEALLPKKILVIRSLTHLCIPWLWNPLRTLATITTDVHSLLLLAAISSLSGLGSHSLHLSSREI